MTEINELDQLLDETEVLEEESSLDQDYLEESYEQVNLLYIPEEAKRHYASKGFDLQWVRIYEPGSHGNLDGGHIQRRENDRYTFVPRNEIPGLGKAMSSYFGEQLETNSQGLYIIGDLALAKFPIARKKAKREWLDNRVQARSKAILGDLARNKVSPNAAHGEKFETVRQQPKGNTVDFGD